MDGKTKSFDKCADGCARSDAITILFLQKAKDAKRYIKYYYLWFLNKIIGRYSHKLTSGGKRCYMFNESVYLSLLA